MSTASHPEEGRPVLQHRAHSWPDVRVMTADMSEELADAMGTHPKDHDTAPSFDEDIDEHPEDHFLSPVHSYEYNSWDSESDDDDDGEIEWNAGITDFALFDRDRRNASQNGQGLDSKWNGFVTGQAEALQRSMHRAGASSAANATSDDVPGLTPDCSPNMPDLDFESERAVQPSQALIIPRLMVTPPREDIFEDDDEDDEPLTFHIQRWQQQRRDLTKANRKLQRPGLRHSRTLSGRSHSWVRPSWNIYPLFESPEIVETTNEHSCSD